ncbi:MAG: anaerobic ribonucleoside-triphosphate reductase activating protein [Candidatus Thermoplasmatota archaeon]|nr:anaerobic ribonucleoside-triphosphate reductase activating protein [Candidatus Thermoplasmatota archaeon]
MDIKGLVEVSFVDWDGKVASVIFLPGCNFRCPMCHNYRLITNPGEFESIPLERILAFLAKRKDFIDGVVITGGEPTIYADLPDLCRTIKNSGFVVKLDTNGYNPEMLKRLIDEKLIDYVAMDIKSAIVKEKYDLAAGADVDVAKIKESIEILMKSGIDYEFRTTVVPAINSVQDISEIARTISGARKFVLQYFRPGGAMDPALRKTKPASKEEMDAILQAAREHVKNTVIRGSPFVGI